MLDEILIILIIILYYLWWMIISLWGKTVLLYNVVWCDVIWYYLSVELIVFNQVSSRLRKISNQSVQWVYDCIVNQRKINVRLMSLMLLNWVWIDIYGRKKLNQSKGILNVEWISANQSECILSNVKFCVNESSEYRMVTIRVNINIYVVWYTSWLCNYLVKLSC